MEGRALSIASLCAFLLADVLLPTLSGQSAVHARRRCLSCAGSVGLALGSITDQMEVALAPVQIDDLAAVEEGILFRMKLYLLIIPFGDERFSAKLDGPGGILSERILSLWIGLLIVPKAYAASGTVTMITDRMRIDAGLQRSADNSRAGVDLRANEPETAVPEPTIPRRSNRLANAGCFGQTACGWRQSTCDPPSMLRNTD